MCHLVEPISSPCSYSHLRRVLPVPEIAVRKRGRMRADRFPNQGAVIVLCSSQFPVSTARILNPSYIPKQQDSSSQRAQRWVWEKFVLYNRRGIIASIQPLLETIQQLIEGRAVRLP